MSLRLFLRTLVVAVAFTAATAIGWWALPVAAAVFGAMTARDRAGPVVALAAAVAAWAAILAWTATQGPVHTVAVTLGGVLQTRPIAVYVLTLAFGGLMALCAAIVARAVARAVAPAPGGGISANRPGSGGA